MLNRTQDRVMLGLFTDDVTITFHSATRESEHSEIARLRPAAGENDLVRLRFNQRRDFVARVIDRGACVAARAMNTGSVPEIFREVRLHRIARGVAKRCGRVVIEINHQALSLSLHLRLLSGAILILWTKCAKTF